MRNLLFNFVLILFVMACQNEPKRATEEPAVTATKTLPVRLSCEDIGSTDEMPRYAVYAIIEERKTKVMEISSACEMIEKAQFANFQIPDDAAAAVGGWWAGAGDYFYAQQLGKKVSIFYAGVDEAQESPGYAYKEIATYENGKFNIKE